ncbi:MAG: PAS domain-containing protein, partial [Victivallaceae bacterium]
MKKIKVILVMAIAILLDSTLLGEEQDALGYGLFPENIFNTGILTIILLLVLVGISGILYFRHQALKAMRQLNEQTAILQEQRITTLRSIGDGVIVTDKDLRITLINQVVTDLTGYSEEEVLGKVAGEVFKLENYDSHAPVEISLKAAIEQNKIYRSHNHTDLIGRDGQRNHIADSAAPIHDSRGRVIGGIMIIHDVTADYERRERLDAVLLKEQNLNGELHNSAIIHNILLENMPCLMVAKDINNDMRYVLCNRSFCKITGRDKTEVLGRVDAECFNNPAELAALSKFDKEAISQAAPTDHVF